MTKKHEDGTINLSDKKVKFWTDEINEETVQVKNEILKENSKESR